MEVIQSEFILIAGNTPLPDVVLLLLAKNNLNEKDCISLVTSEASDRFTLLFWSNRKKLALGQCHFLTPMYCNRLFRRHFSLLSLTIFDAGHAYWIPASTLSNALVQMHNMEELIIHDTKLSLAHLLCIFNTCKKIVKLSFSLLEANLDAHQKDADSFSLSALGFGRITHLKVFTVNQSELYSIDSWPVTLGVLCWCRKCVNLHIEIAYPFIEESESVQRVHNEEVLQLIRQKFKPKLDWFKSLESLVITPRGTEDYPTDPFIYELTEWMYGPLREFLPCSLNRLWIQGFANSKRFLDIGHLPTDFVKSLHLWPDDAVFFQLHHEKFKQIEHLGYIDLSEIESLDHMTQLKYASGLCMDHYGLGDFCKAHSNLEHLIFDTIIYEPEEEGGQQDFAIGDGNWTLPNLKVLCYLSTTPSEDTVGQLIRNCPNIEVLNLRGDTPSGSIVDLPENYNLNLIMRQIQYNKLRQLTLNGFHMFEGDYLTPIAKQCPELRSLHIGGRLHPSVFLYNLGECLSSAKNLRDLRVEWDMKEAQSDVFGLLKKIKSDCPVLERLILHQIEAYCGQSEWENPTELGEFIGAEFVPKLEKLRAFCSAGFELCSEVKKNVNDRLAAEILPSRPSFWIYLGNELPKVFDPNLPKILCDNIVHPIHPFSTSPKF